MNRHDGTTFGPGLRRSPRSLFSRSGMADAQLPFNSPPALLEYGARKPEELPSSSSARILSAYRCYPTRSRMKACAGVPLQLQFCNVTPSYAKPPGTSMQNPVSRN